MKENSKIVIRFLQTHRDEDYTAQDVAQILGMSLNSINGIFTSSVQRKGWGYREETEVELPNGFHERVKYLRLNSKGLVAKLEDEV